MKRILPILAGTACLLLLLRCSTNLAGGTIETTNGYAVGSLVDSVGMPTSNARVTLVPVSYDPYRDGPLPDSLSDTTDASGKYCLHISGRGLYNIEARHPVSKTAALISGIDVAGDDTAHVPAATLRRPGAIRILLAGGSDTANGYVYIPGTTIFARLNNGEFIILDQVPSGTALSLYYAVATKPGAAQTIKDSVVTVPGGTTTVSYYTWKLSRKLFLNTTASGADIPRNITDFPVLVRLTSVNFNFSEAKPGGADLRFTKSDGTPLSYEIERWDASQGSAEIWVKVDTVYGNDATHCITMYWGNSNATIASKSAAVFDTATGFQGVWHMGQAGNTTAYDATSNGYDGIPFNMTAMSAVSGAIGGAQAFDGKSSFVQMMGTADSKLNFPRKGTYSVSAWVNTDTLDSYFHAIATKGDFQYSLEIIVSNEWQFAEVNDGLGWDMTMVPGREKTWTYLTGVRSGDKEYLYVNGVLADSTISLNPSTTAQRYTGFDFMIGRTRDPANDTTGFFFKGIIDEVRCASVAPSADWVKLCYMNQKAGDALVVLKP
jgi:hypothetical protein